MRPVGCRFQIRTPTDTPDAHEYEPISISGSLRDGALRTPYPPAIGDSIILFDQVTRRGGNFRVVDRQWLHPSYGSTYWPVLEDEPFEGPALEIIVVPAPHPRDDQAPRPDDEDGE